ncbi:hypothetical protein [Paenibacillus ehimensis]|uniref:Uncharacterized protein n=1 Tax=Paenibacillus ehimensis TaxID=79264 RepID=A0ABT8V8C6_9BACL|nr:hypothetical protein [Paenibacillus ehimensis]MDO3676699.1 hypothetical protein [Paenibacillus ehimensis]
MNWQEHHLKNAKRCWTLGIVTIVGAAGFGLLDLHFHGAKDMAGRIMFMAECWLFGLSFLGIGFAQRRKAAMKPAAAGPSKMEEEGARTFPHSEMMLKKAASLHPVLRYFSVDGEVLLEFRETGGRLLLLAELLGLRRFMSRSFVLTDRLGRPWVIYRQKAGINPPIEAFLPDGSKLAVYKEGMLKAQIAVSDQNGTTIGWVNKDDLLGTTFHIADGSGQQIIRFFNGGLPSRNFDYFTSGDDLINISGGLASDERLYLRFIGLPAFIKIWYGK